MSTYTNCTEVREDFSALLDEELSGEDVEAIELHLSECSECLRELEAMKQVVEVYDNLPAQSAPDDFTDGIHEALDEDAIAFNRSERSGRRVSMRPVFMAAATLALMAGVSYIAMQGLDGDGTQYAEAPEASMAAASTDDIASEAEAKEALQEEAEYWGDEAEEDPAAKKSHPEFIKGTPEYEKRVELTMKLRAGQSNEKASPKTFHVVVGDKDTESSKENTFESSNPELAELIRSQFTVQEDGMWIQKGYSEQPLTVLEPGTGEYFKFFFRVPHLKHIVRHTRDIIFRDEDTWYSITHEGTLIHDSVLGPPHPKARKLAEESEVAN